MYQVFHDLAALHSRLNQTFEKLGVPLRSEELVVPEFRCVAIGTDSTEMERASTFLFDEGIPAKIVPVALGLDWVPMLYYLCSPEEQVALALEKLRQTPQSEVDLSQYLEGLAVKRIRSERFWLRVGLLLLALWSGGLGILAVMTAQRGRRDLAVLCGLLALLFVGCGYMAFRASRKDAYNS